ncbi:MAG: ABC transporter ATP-binding protein [Clostridia bacterium]|nr:ABC transporter ATP-binding protein [Clostridia bacterium]
MRQSLEQRVKNKINKHRSALYSIKKVFVYAKEYRAYIYLAILADVISSVFELLTPIFLGRCINNIVGVGNVDFSGLTTNSIYLIIFVILGQVTNFLASYWLNAFTYKASYKIRALLFEKFNSLPLSFIDSSSHGDLLSRMINDIDTMTDGFLESIASVLSGVMTVIGTIIAMFIMNIELAIIITILTPMSLLFTLYFVKRAKKFYKAEVTMQGTLSGYLEEYIGGERVVKAFNHEKDSISDFDKVNEDYLKVSIKANYYGNLSNPTTRFINSVVYGVVGLVGALEAIRGSISVGVISSFLSYSNSFGRPFNDISDNISDIQAAFAASSRVFAVLEESDEPSDEKLPNMTDCDGSVNLTNVYFSYIPKVKLIQNFNLDVKPGQKIAIVGPTGCGKSTLINLLMRFYDTNSGTISVSGNDIKTITRDSLRSNYGMVLQETWLFNSTIRENIAYGNPNVPLSDVIEAAKLAGVDEFIQKMPQQYDTIVSEGGSNLSQGEKQLLCIARIMLLKPPMLILDEATSNIDTRTEQKIQAAFETMMKGRTSFIVAHRLSTITNADTILVMNKGNVIEQGTHAELLAKKGFYANLYNSQFEKV